MKNDQIPQSPVEVSGAAEMPEEWVITAALLYLPKEAFDWRPICETVIATFREAHENHLPGYDYPAVSQWKITEPVAIAFFAMLQMPEEYLTQRDKWHGRLRELYEEQATKVRAGA